MSETLNGACLCGAVSISAEPERPSLSVCHCDMCRAWTSSLFMAFQAREDTVTATGPIRTYVSSDWAERAFCETCGSPVWYRITVPGPMHGQRQIAAGLFANAGQMAPKLELYIDKKPDGYALEGARKTLTEAEVKAAYAPATEGDTA